MARFSTGPPAILWARMKEEESEQAVRNLSGPVHLIVRSKNQSTLLAIACAVKSPEKILPDCGMIRISTGVIFTYTVEASTLYSWRWYLHYVHLPCTLSHTPLSEQRRKFASDALGRRRDDHEKHYRSLGMAGTQLTALSLVRLVVTTALLRRTKHTCFHFVQSYDMMCRTFSRCSLGLPPGIRYVSRPATLRETRAWRAPVRHSLFRFFLVGIPGSD